jgi:protein-S-isoprenylcysteine O-methyltransferase Ste14
MISGRLSALLGLILGAIAYWRKVRIEEHCLHQIFGEEYEEYSRITPALIRFRRADYPRPATGGMHGQ